MAFHLAETVGYDLIITSLNLSGSDGLRFCSQVKMIENTRYTPVLLISDPDEKPMLLRALDLGVNDYIIRPIEVNELCARVRTQLRRKIYADRLRSMVTNAVELAITDPLTGLHNRRYLDSHLRSLVERSAKAGKPVAVLAFDLDFFKGINDTYGHDAGDDVLREFSHRLKKSVRGIDLVVRHGGEEFVVVMPETDSVHATIVADRLRQDVENEVFNTRAGDAIPVTVSVGVSEFQGESDSADALMRRADQALYGAKREGRNRVVADAA
jgi:two-component system cell cycle response regulator